MRARRMAFLTNGRELGTWLYVPEVSEPPPCPCNCHNSPETDDPDCPACNEEGVRCTGERSYEPHLDAEGRIIK